MDFHTHWSNIIANLPSTRMNEIRRRKVDQEGEGKSENLQTRNEEQLEEGSETENEIERQ